MSEKNNEEEKKDRLSISVTKLEQINKTKKKIGAKIF